jgi:hypothetical protein
VRYKAKHKRRGRGANREGSLKLAKKKLDEAIDDLARGTRHSVRVEGRIRRVRTLSLYHELQNAVAAHRGGSGGKWSGQFPFWADALVLVQDIDQVVMKIHAAPHSWAGWTIPRLMWLQQQLWRPQDCDVIIDYAKALEKLVQRAEGLFEARPIPIPDPCPVCDEKTVYRDQDGELVRTPALQITEDGCTCGNCKANWPVERLELLGKVLAVKRREREDTEAEKESEGENGDTEASRV